MNAINGIMDNLYSAMGYVNPYYWYASNDDTDKSSDEEQCEVIPLINILPNLLCINVSRSLREDISKMIISFMVGFDLSQFLSPKLEIDYIVDHCPIAHVRKKLKRSTRAYFVNNICFRSDKIVVAKPDFDGIWDLGDKNTLNNLPQKYKENMLANQQSQYVLSKRYKTIPKHIFWWKSIEDSLKEYFVKKFRNVNVAKFIHCDGICDLRTRGFLHNCLAVPPLYDDSICWNNNNDLDVKDPNYSDWYLEMFAECVNVEHKANENCYPYFMIEDCDELVFEMKIVTYSNQKNLSLHIPDIA